jgi:AAA ATPase domain
MVRMGSPVRFRRGAPHQHHSSGRVRCPACCVPEGRQPPFARDLPETTMSSRCSTKGDERPVDSMPSRRCAHGASNAPRVFSSGVAQRRHQQSVHCCPRRFRVERRAPRWLPSGIRRRAGELVVGASSVRVRASRTGGVCDDEVGPAAQAMLVGREGELDTITAAMTAARRGAQRAVHLVGEPGIGKTALAEHAAVMASGQA